jgi:large subunit ribosomal protein L17
MRHRKVGTKLSRDSSHRKAVLRNLVTSLFRHEEISTTHAKAKALRPIAEKMITLAKRGDLHARRQALSYLMDKSVAHKLFGEVQDRFSDRQGGCVRILRAGHRMGDNAPLAIVQLLTADKGKGAGKPAKPELKAEKKARRKAPDTEVSPEVTKEAPQAAEDSTKEKKKAPAAKRKSSKQEMKAAEEKKPISKGRKKEGKATQGRPLDKVKAPKGKGKRAEKT